MKTLRFIVMALFAVVLSMNFTACSSSDGDDNGELGNQGNQDEQDGNFNFEQKHITMLQIRHNSTWFYDRDYTQTCYASYNKYNLLTRIDYTTKYDDGGEESGCWEIDYGKLEISDKNNKYSFVIGSNGCITSIDIAHYGSYKFTYDDERHMLSSIRDGSGTRTNLFSWENGNMVEHTHSDNRYGIDEGTCKLEYSNLINKGKIATSSPFSTPFNLGITLIMKSNGLFGEVNKNLEAKISSTSKKERTNGEFHTTDFIKGTDNFTHKLDENGFVNTISSTYSESSLFSSYDSNSDFVFSYKD